MRRIDTKGNKALSFVLGLVYGYRNASMELVVKDIKEFSQEEHTQDTVYYINRQTGEAYSSFCDEVSHVCVIREDKINKKVVLFIYKSAV
ncbi:MAG: hypothetical protein NZ527_00165 [Hydrogenobacter thermophilus]|uniref:Uncharacterized protein n=1 Tax=Hydrogenobacter thermophilus (strain DSM 6534 / IAM 12695 / TK-6) TaxID=608538 RepID=D3DK96_HYDTT|nr:hypothetical protein [Hydrogenobacter thermophilus]GBC88338.1 hypothetical protein HRbin13_00459 [bacterium HR13]ADO46167.1 conserved hypothetical protein [Hydrogenobacter thermophilus TK-6]MCS7284112.1 hypothetical protein [Hydrogenobacter thermophilus]QWK19301.1 MAG: hypothetical protein KNN13_07305 [Hydrogenobacter thermophilus]BAI70248.1 hypothetical protein HTH_1804 [Hydrogenobacter thermophilus TK-6]